MQLIFMCPSGVEPIGGVTALYEFANGLARRGHEVHLVHLPIWGREITSLGDLDRYRLDARIVHHLPGADPGSLPEADIVFGTGAPARLGLPVLLVQGIDMLHPHLERQAFRTPCLKICVARWLVDVGIRYGVAPDQMEVVPMGIDHDAFHVTVPLEQRPLRVAMLHSTHSAKGWSVALEAVRQVRRRIPELRATVFGTVAPPDPLPDWIEVLVDPPRPVLVEQVYNRCRVFIQASDYEGFGFTAVEAMACGAALVTTDNGGSADYALPEETALLVAPGDVTGLVRHTVALLGDDERRVRLAAAGARFVRRFDWDRAAEQLEAHLERYLADPAAFQRPPGPERPDESRGGGPPLPNRR